MVKNINPCFGDSCEFDSVQDMSAAIAELGYMPEDGLKQGRDYEFVTSYNLTSLTDGVWNDVETFDTLDDAAAFIRYEDPADDDGEEWALVPEDEDAPEFHADSLAALLNKIG